MISRRVRARYRRIMSHQRALTYVVDELLRWAEKAKAAIWQDEQRIEARLLALEARSNLLSGKAVQALAEMGERLEAMQARLDRIERGEREEAQHPVRH
jgi:hypothetical protein